jgi:hypothetical protein
MPWSAMRLPESYQESYPSDFIHIYSIYYSLENKERGVVV